MRVMNSVFRIENDILLLNTYFNSQMYKNYCNPLNSNPTTGQAHRYNKVYQLGKRETQKKPLGTTYMEV